MHICPDELGWITTLLQHIPHGIRHACAWLRGLARSTRPAPEVNGAGSTAP